MDQFLDGGPVDADDLIPAINQRVGRHGCRQRPFVWHDLQPRDRLFRKIEQLARLLRLALGQRHLSKAGGGRPFLALADCLGNAGPFESLTDFGGNNHLRYLVAARNHGLLRW